MAVALVKGAGPFIVDLMGGHVTLGVASVSSVPAVRSGRARLLGIGSQSPAPMFPDAPIISKEVPGFEAIAWFGSFAPGRAPNETVARIHKDVVTVLQNPEVKQRLVEIGAEPGGQTPEDFDARVRAEIAKWQKVAQAAGITPQ